MDQELRTYLDGKFNAIDQKFSAVNQKLNSF